MMERAPERVALSAPWRACLELAWEAQRAGNVPVGAVVVDAEGRVVAEGRNRILDSSGPPGELWHSKIAHAEINALAGLAMGTYTEHTLYTTLEPCLLCASAVVLTGIKTVRYAGIDPLWSGIEQLPQLNAHVARRWPVRHGPLDGPVGRFSTLLPLIWGIRLWPDGPVAASHESAVPSLLRLARDLLATGEIDRLAMGTLTDGLATLWERLERCDADGG